MSPDPKGTSGAVAMQRSWVFVLSLLPYGCSDLERGLDSFFDDLGDMFRDIGREFTTVSPSSSKNRRAVFSSEVPPPSGERAAHQHRAYACPYNTDGTTELPNAVLETVTGELGRWTGEEAARVCDASPLVVNAAGLIGRQVAQDIYLESHADYESLQMLCDHVVQDHNQTSWDSPGVRVLLHRYGQRAVEALRTKLGDPQ